MAVVQQPFRVGDLVAWSSGARGVRRHRMGVVVSVVPGGEEAYRHLPEGKWSHYFDDRVKRSKVSYLVALKGGGRRGDAGQLYHPHVCHLSRFPEGALRNDGAQAAMRRISAKVASAGGYGYHLSLHDMPGLPGVAAGRELVPYRPWPGLSRRDWIVLGFAALPVLALLAAIVRGLGWLS